MNESATGTPVPVPMTREQVAVHSQGNLTAPFDLKWLQTVRAIYETTPCMVHKSQKQTKNIHAKS